MMKFAAFGKFALVICTALVLTGCGGVTSQQNASTSTEETPTQTDMQAEELVLSAEDIAGIQDACLQVFQLDWTNVPPETMKAFARDYTSIKNGAVKFGDEARTTIVAIAELVGEMDESYDWAASEAMKNISWDDLDAAKEEGMRIDEEFQAMRTDIAEEINQKCQAYFD